MTNHSCAQVEVIREAFGYINRFKGETFVLAIDGSLMESDALPSLVRDIVLLQRMGIRIALVPGARERIDAVLKKYNVACPLVQGTRVTTPQAIPFVKMASFDVSNRIMTMLSRNGADAVIGNWVRARTLGVRDGIDYQHTGLVEKVKAEFVIRSLNDGLVAIFPTIGWSSTGTPYNISSSELAATLARELRASKLLFCNRNGGIAAAGLKVPHDICLSNRGHLPLLTVSQARLVLEANRTRRARLLLEPVLRGVEACEYGVNRVHIINGNVDGVLLTEIFSNRGYGTMIHANEYDNVRPMTFADIPDVLALMRPLVEKKALVPRSGEELAAKLGDYIVHEIDGMVHGCGALHLLSPDEGEIAAIGVDAQYEGMGIGHKLVTFLLERAGKMQLRKVVLLTTQAPDWFFEAGFTRGGVGDLPRERRATVNRQRNPLVLVYSPHPRS